MSGGSAPGVVTSQSNLGTIWTSGYDIAASYRLPLRDLGLDAKWGRVDVSLQGNITTKWEIQTIPGVALLDCLGDHGGSRGGSTYKNKFNQRTVWNIATGRSSTTGATSAVRPRSPGARWSRPTLFDHRSLQLRGLRGRLERDQESEAAPVDRQPVRQAAAGSVQHRIGTTSTNSGNTFPAWY